MEQQTVTIAKAGLHASLNARCSVLAAANPVYGQYDREKSPQRNIGLPDSLLSRFDLLFIVLDQLDPKLDRKIASHVVKSHQYRRPGTIMEPEPLNQISKLNLDDNIGIASETVVWQHGNHEEHIHRVIDDNRHTGDVLTKEFFKKYIYYAKTRIQPTLSEDAMTAISNEYANMRSKQSKRNLPITARTLETLIRLSTASAKVRLSVTVDIIDVEIAIELLNFVLFHDVSKYDDEDDGEKADENINTINIPSDGNENRKRTANEIKSSNDLISENMMIDDDTHEESHIRKSSRSQSSVISSENRYEKVCESLYQLLDKRDEIELVTLLKHMNHNIPVQSQYTEDEIRQILYQLYLENKV
jgi:DNA replication licensing factor MCM3